MDWFPWVVSGVMLPSLAALFGFVFHNRARLADIETRMEQRLGDARQERIEQIADTKASCRAHTDDTRRAMDMQLIASRDEFKGFQIKVLEEFAPNRALKDLETRVILMLEKMDAKIDKIADRLGR